MNLLLKNPMLNKYANVVFKSSYITQALGTELRLPSQNHNNLPFIFSCFALSIDGKLCYPDNQSGFSIASSNRHATEQAQKTDWWFLMLARCISDAIIIGSNSLNLENGNYVPTLDVEELISARYENGLSVQPWVIMIVRDLNNLNLTQTLFQDSKIPVIICSTKFVDKIPPQFSQHRLSNLNTKSQLTQKNIVTIDTNYAYMFQIFKQLGFNNILNESPYIHHLLLEQQLLNEIWLNYSSSYIGGNVTSLGNKQNSFSSINHPDTEILTLHHVDYHFLYSRQKVIPHPACLTNS